MQPVQRLAEGREKDAVARLGQSQQYLDAQKAKLDELRAYREQYARDFAASAENGLDAGRVRDYRIFLNRLGEAIRQQEVLVTQSLSAHEQTRQAWVETRSQMQAIDKVVERYRVDERKQHERREQREADERAQRPPKR